MKRSKKLKYLGKAIIYLLIVFIGLELGLRMLGYRPYKPPAPQAARFLEHDSFKGWVHIPGNYQFIVNSWGDTMNFVINQLGERVTKATPIQEAAEEILLIGGSFTMGMGLNDDQTFAWKLQKKYPSVDFRNLGVGAYSTYQSLLVLEEELKRENKPKAVIYGFINHHRVRNVSESDWLYSLQAAGEQSAVDLVLPYVSVGENGTLQRHKTAELVRIPFAKSLATSFMTQKAINRFLEYDRVSQADEVLEKLLLEMQDLCRKHDVPFYVNVLACDSALMSKITAVFEQHSMAYIDCNVPLNKRNTFRDDGHPKEEVNEEWAKRIEARLVDDGILE